MNLHDEIAATDYLLSLSKGGAGSDKRERDRRCQKLGMSRSTLHRKINEMNLAKAKADRSSAS